MIYSIDVVEKYASNTIIGVVNRGEAKKSRGAAKSALSVSSDMGDAVENSEAWGDWRMEALDDEPGVFWVMVRPYVHAYDYLIISVTYEICASILSAKNFKISSGRTGRTRIAVLLIRFIVVHVDWNLHVFKGPEDFVGCGYFFVLFVFRLQANVFVYGWVEEEL